MSSNYSRDMLKVSVAKVLQTLGWHSVNTTPVEIITDYLKQYICHIGKLTNEYANQYNSIDPNLDHLALAFRDLNVDLCDLEEYVKYVDFGPTPTPVPKFPVPKEDHLNFLKPGSKEVVTRPVHVNEHLPPMSFSPERVENEPEEAIKQEEPEDMAVEATPVFKRPSEVLPGDSFKKPRLCLEEEGRPTREISSVMMTTSGYLSPAREGKLPESRTPQAAVEPAIPNNPVVPTTEAPTPPARKTTKVFKKVAEKKKERVGKELFKHAAEDGIPLPKPKKTPGRDPAKSKLQPEPMMCNIPTLNDLVMNSEMKIYPVPPIVGPAPSPKQQQQANKINRALQAARLKTEKLNTTITPIPMKTNATNIDNIDKLFSEPDKKKVNIFKKISNVKNEKLETKIIKIKEENKLGSRESSPDLIIDESVNEPVVNRVHRISNDITIELIDPPPAVKTPDKLDRSYFDAESPPGTPSTPKTPEMISQSPPLGKEKKKRKDKTKVKKVQKQPMISPAQVDPDIVEIDLERPKTPEALIVKPDVSSLPIPNLAKFPFFAPFNPGPGLIPQPLSNTLFPHLQLPLVPGFGQPPYIPPVHPRLHYLPRPVKEELQREPSPPKCTPELVPTAEPPVLPAPSTSNPAALPSVPEEPTEPTPIPKPEKKVKEHKKEKKDKIKKKNKKDKNKDKAEKKKLKEEKKDKEKLKKEKKEKKKEKEVKDPETPVPKLTLKLGSASPLSFETPERKLNIKPVVKKEEEEEKQVSEVKREMSPELAKISALVTGQPKAKVTPPIPPIKEEVKEEVIPTVVGSTPRSGTGPGRPRIHPIKPKPTKPNTKRQLPVKDSDGNEIWICPACGKQDDGSPMIGCDDCDAWYHWFCVGIQVPPDDNENWYCRICIVKKQEDLRTDKKKKRKKREKKEH